MNEFSNVVGYKVKIEKSVAFLCTNIKISGQSKKKKIHLKSCQRNKIPKNKLIQEGETPIH